MTRRRDAEREILEALQPYLDSVVDRYRQDGTVTLPVTNDGKVNVMGLCRDAGLSASDAQHLHRKQALADAVNLVAEELGLAPIGSRALADARDEAAQREVKKARKDAKQQGEDVVALRRELDAMTQELERVKAERDRYAAMIREIYDGGDLPAGIVDEVRR
jgi:hypothetical protein